jgi:hypothetical protein
MYICMYVRIKVGILEVAHDLVEDRHITRRLNNESECAGKHLYHEQASSLTLVTCRIHKSNDSSCLIN